MRMVLPREFGNTGKSGVLQVRMETLRSVGRLNLTGFIAEHRDHCLTAHLAV